MIELNLKKISEILNVNFSGDDVTIKGMATDSRLVKPGNLFITWAGAQLDGHQFCVQAVEQGAVALMVNRPLAMNVPQIIVSDSIEAFGKIAHYWRQQFSIPMVGVTGSNGKTTVKNMLSSIMRAAVGENYLAPKKSFNNFVGVPLTLCELTASHRYAVIEMGMNHFGELSYLTQLVNPSVTVITNAGPSHLAGVGGTLQGVAKAKGEILEGLSSQGTAVLNADDPFFPYWAEKAAAHKILSFGIEQSADLMAQNIQQGLTGSTFDLVYLSLPSGGKANKETVHLPLLGRHNILNALAATAAALAIGIDIEHIKQGLRAVEPEPHRLQVKQAIGGAVLLDDSYNANPNSVRKAIDVLRQFSQQRVLILGDMRELGETEVALHVEIGQYAKAAGIEHLCAVGDLMQHCVASFGDGAQHFADKQALLTHLKQYLDANHVILVKGSLSMKMKEVVDYLVCPSSSSYDSITGSSIKVV